jgi:hypothetical protein
MNVPSQQAVFSEYGANNGEGRFVSGPHHPTHATAFRKVAPFAHRLEIDDPYIPCLALGHRL